MIEQLAARIQKALESGDFDTALPLIESYGKAVKTAMQTARTSHQRSEVAGSASAFLRDRLHLARVMRSQLATRLLLTRRLVSYSEPPAPANSWLLEG
ncbi:MAG TPA: hypothetical protein VHZ55_25720 [Bryobacteraceae bacterium]|jgi:hypothetical protein|nr:hypothetical protein [Bryobacteraceae bacterium]